jgi:hypothetical protein
VVAAGGVVPAEHGRLAAGVDGGFVAGDIGRGAGGLGPPWGVRAARFADVYHARCPGGTFVQLDG